MLPCIFPLTEITHALTWKALSYTYRPGLAGRVGRTLAMSANLAVLSPSAVIAVARHNLTLVSSVVACLAIVLTVRYFQSPWRKLPPGPKGLPFLGNVLQMRSKQWLNFMKWKQEFGQRSLDRRAGIYSDRPRNIVAAEILCGGMAMVFQNYGHL